MSRPRPWAGAAADKRSHGRYCPRPGRIRDAAGRCGAEPAARGAARAGAGRAPCRDRRRHGRGLGLSAGEPAFEPFRRVGEALRRSAAGGGNLHLCLPAAPRLRGGVHQRRPAHHRGRRADPDACGHRDHRHRRDRRRRAVAIRRVAAHRLPAARRGDLDHRPRRGHRGFPRRRRAGAPDAARRGRSPPQRRRGDCALYRPARDHRLGTPARHRKRRDRIRPLLSRRRRSWA